MYDNGIFYFDGQYGAEGKEIEFAQVEVVDNVYHDLLQKTELESNKKGNIT